MSVKYFLKVCKIWTFENINSKKGEILPQSSYHFKNRYDNVFKVCELLYISLTFSIIFFTSSSSGWYTIEDNPLGVNGRDGGWQRSFKILRSRDGAERFWLVPEDWSRGLSYFWLVAEATRRSEDVGRSIAYSLSTEVVRSAAHTRSTGVEDARGPSFDEGRSR